MVEFLEINVYHFYLIYQLLETYVYIIIYFIIFYLKYIHIRIDEDI